MVKKKLPVGISDFKKIIEGGYYYVDKTDFVKEILEKKAKATLITRPRRFGKTLSMTTLKYFLDIKDAENNKDLLVVDEYKKVHHGIAMLGYETLNSFLYSNSHFFVKDQRFEDSEKKCRICHKKESNGVTFENKAHIVPEFLGNTTYFSYYECDSCNLKYGELEEKLKNFLSFELYHVGIRNTKKECNVYNVTKNGCSGIYSSPINQPYTLFKKIVSEVSGSEGK